MVKYEVRCRFELNTNLVSEIVYEMDDGGGEFSFRIPPKVWEAHLFPTIDENWTQIQFKVTRKVRET